MEIDFKKYAKILDTLDENERQAFLAYTIASSNDINEKDGPIAFLFISLMKQNLEMKEELNQLRKSHTSLMSIYADNNN